MAASKSVAVESAGDEIFFWRGFFGAVCERLWWLFATQAVLPEFRKIAGRTFYRDDAGVFIEAGLEGELKPSVILEVLADETFALLMEIPALVPFVSANLDLLVCVDGVVYRLLALK